MIISTLGIFLKTITFFVILSLSIALIILVISKLQTNNNQKLDNLTNTHVSNLKVSGWVPWWAEQKSYNLIDKFPERIDTVSPVWFSIDEDLNLVDKGSMDRSVIINRLRNSNVKILPSLGSELTGKKISPFLQDKKKSRELISSLSAELVSLGVNGVDIDLEGVRKEDKNAFTSFLNNLSDELKKNNLYLSITIHAQTSKVTWEGVEGQDLEKIGEIADEVRIMIYDEHTSGSKPGSVSSFKWAKDVIKYNLSKIPQDKIVVGIPSYGYIWAEEDSKGLQFDEFNKYLEEKKHTQKRDNKSGELIVRGNGFSGWLSDSTAMNAKINLARSLGINKFVIWHLGGLDENFFGDSLPQ